MTPFKERMNLYRAYRELNPDKNYWDWKQSLEVPAMQNGGNTVEDYITQQIQVVRDAAYQNSLDRTMPRVPYQGGLKNTISKEQFEADKIAKQTSLQLQLDSLPKQLNPATGQYSTSLMYKHVEDALTKQLAEVNASAYQDTNNGAILPSCIYTATDNYGEQYLQPSTVAFMLQAGKNGFREIPIDDVKKGDIVIRSENGQNHGMIFDGYDTQGRRLYNHSNGGHTAEAIRKHAKYPATDDMLKAYEFVGTAKDSARWISEYERLLNNVPAMLDGGENKLLLDPARPYVDEYGIVHRNRYANGAPYEQGLELDPVTDMFNPMNDVYDVVQIGKDATEGNWAGVGTGLVVAAMPKWMEKVGGAVKSGVKSLINKARHYNNVDWDEIVSGLAIPVKKDPMGIDAMPISSEIKVDHRRVAGLTGEKPPRYLDYGDVLFEDHIGYTRPQWLKDVLEFYDTDVAARERRFAVNEGMLYKSPVYQNRSDITFNSEHPVHVRQYLDDTKFAGYANRDGIVMVRNSKLPSDLILVHEGTHIDQDDIANQLVPTTELRFANIGGESITYPYYVPTLEKTLNRAYEFTEDFLEKHPNLFELFEMGASNREMRYAIWKAHGKPNMEELDKIIDNMSDDDIRYLLTLSNSYTRDFNRRIIEKEKAGEDVHYDVEMIKQALKYVPVLAAPMMINNTEDNSN